MDLPSVIAQFTPNGILLFTVGKNPYQRMLSWKELEKLAKKGKKAKIPDIMKDASKKLTELIENNKTWQKKTEEYRKQAAEGLRVSEAALKDIQKRSSAVAVPLTPMPRPPAPPIVPPPTGN